jgi:hypothetical protein
MYTTKSDKSDSKSCTYRNFLACKPEVFKGDKSATDALRWIKEMETTIDISGCKDDEKVCFATNSFKGEPLEAEKKLRVWVGETS